MLSFLDYAKLDAIALAMGIRNKEFTATEVMQCAIERAQKVNPSINAIVHENYEQALALAAQFEQNPSLLDQSNVAGLPFLIKDLGEVKGLPTSFGSHLYKDYISTKNSNIISKYMDAGLLVMGKTNTPEFGVTLTTEPQANGPCHNPWNTEYSPGGSSGGAAAAVAAGIVPVAHASDGGGSIRIPASCCGLFGLKPSRGLTAIEDTIGESWSGMTVGHVVSRSVRDSAAFLDLIKLNKPHLYPLPNSPASHFSALHEKTGNDSTKRLKIALQLTHPSGEQLDEDCVLAAQKAAEYCASLGHQIEEVSHPVDHLNAAKAMSVLINTHVSQAVLKRVDALQLSLDDCPLENSTRIMAKRGADIRATDFLAARDSLTTAERQMNEFHQKYDVIIQAVLSKTPAKLGWLNMNSEDMKDYAKRFKSYSGLAALANGTGQPSMSVPLHQTKEKIPVGVMFTAAWGNDMILLQLAAELEPWFNLFPALPEAA